MSKLEEGVKPKQEIVGLLPENQILLFEAT
jgi:hypothetical protein